MATAHEGTSLGGTTTGDLKRAFDFSASDFATIVTTKAYVDKSLMIRDFYSASSRIMITAPRRFGKSTNLTMVKRFFEIEVDSRGNPKTVHTTNNYKLFNDYNLEICKDIGFFNEHFGKHPVVYIDFKPLGGIHDSAKILGAFKTIVENSLNQHSYILQNSLKEHVFSGIAGFYVNDFTKYISDGIIKDIDGLNLADSFKHLSTILSRVFGKKVFVLIDSYDAFLDSLAIKNKTDRQKIMLFVESSVGRLLDNVNCVDRVLITGVIPMIGEGFLCSDNNIECHHFLDSHPFTTYYGLANDEVEKVLSKFIESNEERRDVQSVLNDFYTPYIGRMYNIWSVLQYVCKRRVQSYWCERRHINKLKNCFKMEPIRQKLEELLLDEEFELDMSQPLSVTDVMKVYTTITCSEDNEDEHLSIEVEVFLALLYHSGYLSVYSEMGRGVVCVDIPSKEINYELAKAVFHEYRELYSSSHMDAILSVLDAFDCDSTDLLKNIEQFNSNLCYLHKNNNCQCTHVLQCLFMNLCARAQCSEIIWRKLWDCGLTAVLLKNKHKVAICVTGDDAQSASIVHQKVTNDDSVEHAFNELKDVRGKVIIAIDSSGRIAYSYYFKTGDNLQEVRTLPNNRTQ